MKVLPNMSHMSRRRKVFLVLLLLALVCTARHWCAALLDGVRHTVDLSFTIEWGPTYWVDDCMAALGRPGVGRLCATTVDDRKYVAYGASSALGGVDNPGYARLFIATVNNPNVHPFVRETVLENLCRMKSSEATDFVKACFRDENQPDHNRWVVARCLAYYGDLSPVKEITRWSHRPDMVAGALSVLADIAPAAYLRDFIGFVCDENKPQKSRQESFTQYEWDHRMRQLPDGINRELESILGPVFAVNKPDGTPDNDIRSAGWCMLFSHTKKAVPLVLANEQDTDNALRRMVDAAQGLGPDSITHGQASEIIRNYVSVPQFGLDGENHLNRVAKEILGHVEE